VETALLSIEAFAGRRIVLGNILSDLHMPSRAYKRYLDNYGESDEDPNWRYEIQKTKAQRLSQFRDQVGMFEHIDLVPESFVHAYAAGRARPLSGGHVVERELAVEHLKAIIGALQSHSNYHLLMVPDSAASIWNWTGAFIAKEGAPPTSVNGHPWTIYYESRKLEPGGELVSVAFETVDDDYTRAVVDALTALRIWA
jgi:hypothetical protein